MASDAKVRTLGEAPRNMVYLPYSQRFTPLLTVVARTPIRPGADGGREPGDWRQEGLDGGRLAAEARVDRLHLLKAAEEEAGLDEQ